MKYRKLRIAWSVGCVIAGVLVCILWMRSYEWHESVSSRHVWPRYVAVPLLESRPYTTDPDAIYHSRNSPADYRAMPFWITWNAVSRRGQLTLTLHRTPARDGYQDRIKEVIYSSLEHWAFGNDQEKEIKRLWFDYRYGVSFAGFGFRNYENYRSYALGLTAPHWFSMIALGAFAAAPWISWSRRFSLRALLIATTLVAVLLGWVVWVVGR